MRRIHVTEAVAEGKVFPYPSWVVLADLTIKLTQGVFGEKKNIWTYRELIDVEPKKWPKRYLLYKKAFRQRINLWGLDRTKTYFGCSISKESINKQSLGLGVVKEVTKLVIEASWPAFPIPGDKGVLSPDSRSVPFTEISFLLSGRQKGGSECPSGIGHFLSDFNSK